MNVLELHVNFLLAGFCVAIVVFDGLRSTLSTVSSSNFQNCSRGTCPQIPYNAVCYTLSQLPTTCTAISTLCTHTSGSAPVLLILVNEM